MIRMQRLMTVTIALGLFFAPRRGESSISSATGLDTFDGTAIDASTYRIINDWVNPASLTQNNALIFSNIPGSEHVTGIVTRFSAIGVGGAAQVQINATRVPSPPTSSFAVLCLTTDSAGSWYVLDSYALACEVDYSSHSFLNEYAAYPDGDGSGQVIPIVTGRTCTFRIERLSETSVRASVLDA